MSEGKPLCILCDIDGTIALRGDRSPYAHEQSIEDAPNWPVVHLVERLSFAKLILVTGRMEQHRPMTEYWLRTFRIFEHRELLLMRTDDDRRADYIIKRELYERFIEPSYQVLCVFDDRNQVVKMWREIGLLCLQVADGDF